MEVVDMRILKSYLIKMWERAKEKNDENILKLLESDSHAKLLDLGCNNGRWTLKVAEKIGTKNVYGIEINDDAVEKSIREGIVCKKSDLNERFPFEDNFFDVVHANQVIEHIVNVDLFVSEISRVLKRGGYCVISTENLSAIDNLIALFFGQQAFSQHISKKYHIGNIFSPHYGEVLDKETWSHKIIFTYYGLQDLLETYNFKIEKILAAGFFPLPNFLSTLDPIHSHFITII